MEPSGLRVEKLDYAGDLKAPENNITDDDVRELAAALEGNHEFSGLVDLSNNDLSDLSALYLKEALERPGAKNFTKINFACNPRLSEKAGICVG